MLLLNVRVNPGQVFELHLVEAGYGLLQCRTDGHSAPRAQLVGAFQRCKCCYAIVSDDGMPRTEVPLEAGYVRPCLAARMYSYRPP